MKEFPKGGLIGKVMDAAKTVKQMHIPLHAAYAAYFIILAFFPALVLGIFWKRANKIGAICGMAAGLLVTMFYMVRVEFDAIPWLGIHGIGMAPWFGIQSTSAGVWGVAAGSLTIVMVSLLGRPPDRETQDFVVSIRFPDRGSG